MDCKRASYVLKIYTIIFNHDYKKLANPRAEISKRLIEYQDYLTNMYGSEYLKRNDQN